MTYILVALLIGAVVVLLMQHVRRSKTRDVYDYEGDPPPRPRDLPPRTTRPPRQQP